MATVQGYGLGHTVQVRKGKVKPLGWKFHLVVYWHGRRGSRRWRQSAGAVLLYASLFLLVSETPSIHAEDMENVQQSCVRPIVHRCDSMRSEERQAAEGTQRLAFASLLHACVRGDGPTPRPLRIFGPDGAFTRTLTQLLSPNSSNFVGMTGIPIQYVPVSPEIFSRTRKQRLTDPTPPNATSGYDAILLSPSAFGDADQVPGKMMDLSLLVANDAILDWEGFPPPLRANTVTYDNAIVALPLLPVPWFMYYHLGIFKRDGLTPPRTWEELADLAERYHGQEGLIGACIWLPNCRSESLVLRYILASYLQTHGPSQGYLWDSATLEPLVDTPAMVEAMKILRRLRKVGIYNSTYGQSCIARDFNVGRCLLTISEAGEFKTVNLKRLPMRGLLGMSMLPGSTRVLDRTTRQLVTCDTARCPLAHESIEQDGQLVPVNRAPYILNTVVLINGLSPLAYQLLAYTFFAYVASPSVIGMKAWVLDDNDLLPVRTEDMALNNLQYWVDRGYDADDAARFLPLFKSVSDSPNPMVDLKTHFSSNVTSALLKAGLTALSTNVSEQEAIRLAVQGLDADLKAIVATVGLESFAEQYRKSLRSLNWAKAPGPDPAQPPALRDQTQKQSARLLPVAVAVPCGMALLLAAALTGVLLMVRRRRKAARTVEAALRRPPKLTPCTTLVVTDIQDSTALWEALDASVMDASLKLHHRVLRAALLEHHGYESATEGDSFIMAFHHPSHAVAFCVAAQQALLEAPWPRELLHHPPLSSASHPWDDPAGIVTMIHRPSAKLPNSTRSAMMNRVVGPPSRRKISPTTPSAGAAFLAPRASNKTLPIYQPTLKEAIAPSQRRPTAAYGHKPAPCDGSIIGSGGQQGGDGGASPGCTAFGAGGGAWALQGGSPYRNDSLGLRGVSGGAGSGSGCDTANGEAYQQERRQLASPRRPLPLPAECTSVLQRTLTAPAHHSLHAWLYNRGCSGSGLPVTGGLKRSASCAPSPMPSGEMTSCNGAQLAMAVAAPLAAGDGDQYEVQEIQQGTCAIGGKGDAAVAAAAASSTTARRAASSRLISGGNVAGLWLPSPTSVTFQTSQTIAGRAASSSNATTGPAATGTGGGGTHRSVALSALSALPVRGAAAKLLNPPVRARTASDARAGTQSSGGYPRSAAAAAPPDRDFGVIHDGAVPATGERSMSAAQLTGLCDSTGEVDSDFHRLPPQPQDPTLPFPVSADEGTAPVPTLNQRPPTLPLSAKGASAAAAPWFLSGSGGGGSGSGSHTSLGQVNTVAMAPRSPGVLATPLALQAPGESAEGRERLRQQEWQMRCGISRVSLLFSLRQKWELLPPVAAPAGDDSPAGCRPAASARLSRLGTAESTLSTSGGAAGGEAGTIPATIDGPTTSITQSNGSRSRRRRAVNVANELTVVVYRGLRVRMGCVCTVYPGSKALRNSAAGGRMQYSGAALRMAKAVADAAHGGMVIFADCVYDCLCRDAASSSKALSHVQLLWLGRHRVADDLPAVHLIQAVAHGSAMVGRLVLQRPPRSLAALLPPGAVGALAAPVLGSGAVARVAVPTAAALLAWNHRVASEALELLHFTLLDALVWAVDDVPYVVDGVMGLVGPLSSLPSAAGARAGAGHPTDTSMAVRGISWRFNSISDSIFGSTYRSVTAATQVDASNDGGGTTAGGRRLSPTGLISQYGGEATPPGNSPWATDGRSSPNLSPWTSPVSLSKRAALPSRPDTGSQSQLQALPSVAPPAAAGPRTAPQSAPPQLGRWQRREAGGVSKAGGGPACAGAPPGTMTAVFRNPCEAARWLLYVMASLPSLPWPTELLEHPLCEELVVDSLTLAERRGRGPDSGLAVLAPRMTATGVQAPPSAPTSFDTLVSKSSHKALEQPPPQRHASRSGALATLKGLVAVTERSGITPRGSALGKGPESGWGTATGAGEGAGDTVALSPLPSGPLAAGNGAFDQGIGPAAADGGTLLVLRGLRARAAFAYGELDGEVPSAGSLCCQVSYKGRAWSQSASALARSKPGRVASNAETAVLLPQDLVSRLTVEKGGTA